ncbi:hypothetical protein GCM10010404_00330 [Nonomuraea africana]
MEPLRVSVRPGSSAAVRALHGELDAYTPLRSARACHTPPSRDRKKIKCRLWSPHRDSIKRRSSNVK